MGVPVEVVDGWIKTLWECKYLPEADLKKLCNAVKLHLVEESNVHPVSSPVILCGDLHGQFHDLLNALKLGGPPPESNYIFMVRVFEVNSHSVLVILTSRLLFMYT